MVPQLAVKDESQIAKVEGDNKKSEEKNEEEKK